MTEKWEGDPPPGQSNREGYISTGQARSNRGIMALAAVPFLVTLVGAISGDGWLVVGGLIATFVAVVAGFFLFPVEHREGEEPSDWDDMPGF